MGTIVELHSQVDRDGAALSFFSKVLPPSGLLCAAIKKGAVFQDIFCEGGYEELWAAIREADRDEKKEVYFALASFANNGRKQSDIIQLKALSCDIDYGQAGHSAAGYATLDDAAQALKGFCARVPLPPPIVVKSGGGLQAHWAFLEPMPLSEWQKFANGLKSACLALELRADHGLTINGAHIMRPPWATNRKIKGSPRPVELTMLASGPYPKDAFEPLLAYAPARGVPSKLLGKPAWAPEAPDEAFPDRRETFPEAKLAGCGVVQRFRNTGECSEPAWMRLAALYHYVDDGEELFQANSARGYAGYNQSEARTKFDRAGALTGPPVCEGFRDATDEKTRAICLACPFNGQIVTPIDLGRQPDEEPVVEAPEAKEIKKAPYSVWDLSKEGGKKPNFKNACLAVNRLNLVCEYDVFHKKRLVDGEELEESVVRTAREQSIVHFKLDPGKEHMWEALNAECERNEFNPVADYLNSLRWDGKPRLDTWLMTYLGCEDTPLNRAFGRKTLIAGVRRVFTPGCKFDYLLILEGPQRAGKSTAWRILAGDENFSDEPIKWDTPRQHKEVAGGTWVHEIAELVGLKKADIEAVKSFLSRQNDRARAAYARAETDQLRQCIFVGTTNGGVTAPYLSDFSGGSRFWPVVVGRIDLKSLARDRDQIWAEAVGAEKSGEAIELPPELYDAAEEQQTLRRVIDPWQDVLARIGGEKVSSYAIFTEHIGISKDKMTPHDGGRIAAIMRSLRWDGPKPVRVDGVVVKGYTRE